MFRWLGVLVAAASLSWFAVLLVTGNYYNEGPVVFVLSLSRGIGVHRGDIGVVAFWAAGMIGLFIAASRRHQVRSGRGSAGVGPPLLEDPLTSRAGRQGPQLQRLEASGVRTPNGRRRSGSGTANRH